MFLRRENPKVNFFVNSIHFFPDQISRNFNKQISTNKNQSAIRHDALKERVALLYQRNIETVTPSVVPSRDCFQIFFFFFFLQRQNFSLGLLSRRFSSTLKRPLKKYRQTSFAKLRPNVRSCQTCAILTGEPSTAQFHDICIYTYGKIS